MEIKIDREQFYKCVSRTQGVIAKKYSSMPILSAILLKAAGNKLHILATDLELAFEQITDADVIQEGSVAVSGRKLFEILRESRADKFHIKAKENNRIFLSDGVARFELAGHPPDEYPVFVELEGVSFIEINGKIFHEMINKTVYATAKENYRIALTGVSMASPAPGMLRMVATDGHRLSLVDKPMPDIESLLKPGKGIIVPQKGILEVSKLVAREEQVKIGVTEKTFVARTKKAILAIRLFEAAFPDYQGIVFGAREPEATVKVKRILLLEGLRRMSILSDNVYVSVSADSLKLASINSDIGRGEELLTVQYEGSHIILGFNPRYFIDILQSMESEEVVLAFTDKSKPCILKGDEGFLGLVMPLSGMND